MSTQPVIPIGSGTPPPLEPSPSPAESAARRRTSPEEIAAWLLLASAIAFVLIKHLVGAAIMGLTLYAILETVSRRFARRMSRSARRPLALLIVAILTGALITFAVALSATVARRGADNIPDMMEQMADILGSVRLWLGGL